MKTKSILIKDTTKEDRIRIVQEGLNQCGGACDFCNGCDNLGGGSVDAFYEPYINGEKELRELNEEYRSNTGRVKWIMYRIPRKRSGSCLCRLHQRQKGLSGCIERLQMSWEMEIYGKRIYLYHDKPGLKRYGQDRICNGCGKQA